MKNKENYTLENAQGQHYDTNDRLFYGDNWDKTLDGKEYLKNLVILNPKKFEGFKIVKINTMKISEEIKDLINNSFKHYYKGIAGPKDLSQDLTDYENHLKEENYNFSLWFKFSADDTGAHTINDLRDNLDPRTGTTENRQYYNDMIKEAVQNKSLIINFS